MTEWNPDNPADLGIWDDLGWTQPPPAKKAKSLKLKKKAGLSGFHSVIETLAT